MILAQGELHAANRETPPPRPPSSQARSTAALQEVRMRRICSRAALQEVRMRRIFPPAAPHEVRMRRIFRPAALHKVRMRRIFPPAALQEVRMRRIFPPAALQEVRMRRIFSRAALQEVRMRRIFRPAALHEVRMRRIFRPAALHEVRMRRIFPPALHEARHGHCGPNGSLIRERDSRAPSRADLTGPPPEERVDGGLFVGRRVEATRSPNHARLAVNPRTGHGSAIRAAPRS